MRPFTILARCLAAVCAVACLLWSRDLLSLMGTQGLVDPRLSAAYGADSPLSIYRLVPPDSGRLNLALAGLLNSVAVLAALLFWRPRSVLAALGLYLAFTAFKQSAGMLAYGLYQYVQIGLFYVMAANLVAFLERDGSEEGGAPVRWVGLAARAHLAMAYLFSGLCKAVGPQWWTGESMWRALARSDSSGMRLLDMAWTGRWPLLLQAVGIAVVVAETTYPLAFLRRPRRWIVGAMVAMHVGTILTQGLVLFGLAMIALNVFFLLESEAWDRARDAAPAVPAGRPATALRSFFLLALVALAGAALAQDKPVPIVDSPAAAKNLEAVGLYRIGRYAEALRAVDQASLLAPSDPRPWVNGALFSLAYGRIAQAQRASREAWLMGDRSPRRRTLDIEIDVARGQLEKAWDGVRSAEFDRPEDPYLHLARARWADAAGEERVAERSRWQAFRSGRTALLDSRLFSDFGATGRLGAPETALLEGRWRRVDPDLAFVADGRLALDALGGAAKARQRLARADVDADLLRGSLMLAYRGFQGDRPGLPSPSLLGPATPGAALRVESFLAGWQRRLGGFTLNANYREAVADLRSGANAPYLRNIRQDQWMLEGRYDSGPWTLGTGLSRVERDAVASPAIEPLEDVFDPGTTRLAHAYAVHRRDYGRSVRLISGGVLSAVDGSTSGLLTAELAVRLFGDRFLRLGAKPTMSRAGAVLFPEDLRAGPLARNPIDPPFASSLDGSRRVAYFRPTGKSLDLYASLPLLEGPRASVGIAAFQQRFTGALFASGDPRQQAALRLVPVSSGRVTGATMTASVSPSPAFEATLRATAQSSRADYGLSVAESRAPEVPNLSAGLSLGGAVGSLSVAVSADYVGGRVQASPANDQKELATRRVGGAWSLGLSLSRPLGGGILSLDVLNPTRAAFYRGYGSGAGFGLTYRTRL